MPTFAQSYCQRHGLADDQFAQAVLRRALYPQARLILPLIESLAPAYFAADLELIADLGRMRSTRHFRDVSADYRRILARSGFARRSLRVRVSMRQLRDIMADSIGAGVESPITTAEQRPA